MNQLALDLQPTVQEYRIPLTQGQFALVDPADYVWLVKLKWCAQWTPHTQSFYAVRGAPLVAMHRLIMQAPKGIEVDHENHNTLDNRRYNLRLANRSQNACNQRLSTANTSGVRGVCWNRRARKWYAQIEVKGRKIYLGTFGDLESAQQVYAEAAKQLHGDFAF